MWLRVKAVLINLWKCYSLLFCWRWQDIKRSWKVLVQNWALRSLISYKYIPNIKNDFFYFLFLFEIMLFTGIFPSSWRICLFWLNNKCWYFMVQMDKRYQYGLHGISLTGEVYPHERFVLWCWKSLVEFLSRDAFELLVTFHSSPCDCVF